MMTPAPEQIIARSREHDRVRASAANIKPQRRLQLVLAVGEWPAWLTDAGSADRATADAAWNERVEA